jgi:hypothetical protein
MRGETLEAPKAHRDFTRGVVDFLVGLVSFDRGGR